MQFRTFPGRVGPQSPARLGLRPGRAARAEGFSLIETLVSLLLVSIGMLATAGLIGTAAKFSKTAEFRTVANLFAMDMVERMRANRAGLAPYSLNPRSLADAAPRPSACKLATACTPLELAQVDLAEWQALLFHNLPRGTGYIRLSNAAVGLLDVWVLWNDPASLSGAEWPGTELESVSCPPPFQNMAQQPRCVHLRVAL
jgi:type IV pilus assembly protein PilV